MFAIRDYVEAGGLMSYGPNLQDLWRRAAEYGHQGTFVSDASSAAVGGGKLEIEIQTHRQFRRRGSARAVAAALILYCLKHGLEPCWDAANEPSAASHDNWGFTRPGNTRRTD
jgi:GNAT superfamily N-acetyltransferase